METGLALRQTGADGLAGLLSTRFLGASSLKTGIVAESQLGTSCFTGIHFTGCGSWGASTAIGYAGARCRARLFAALDRIPPLGNTGFVLTSSSLSAALCTCIGFDAGGCGVRGLGRDSGAGLCLWRDVI